MSIDIEAFRKSVYEVTAAIPKGKVTTYGQIARLVGYPQHARAVGRILRGTSARLQLPCHRIVNSQGRTAPHWVAQKELLKAENVTFKRNGCVDMERCAWNWESMLPPD